MPDGAATVWGMDATDIIARAGGVNPLARALKVWPGTVRAWIHAGIPDRRWEVIMDMTGATVEEMYEFNQHARKMGKRYDKL